jgi:hypothetical protein
LGKIDERRAVLRLAKEQQIVVGNTVSIETAEKMTVAMFVGKSVSPRL